MLGKKNSSFEFNYGLYERYQFDYKNAQFYIPHTERQFYEKDDRGITYICRDIDNHTPIIFQSYETIIFFAHVCNRDNALAPNDRLLSVFYSKENMHYSRTTCKQTKQAISELMRLYGCTRVVWTNLDELLIGENGIHSIQFPSYEWRSKHRLEMYLKINFDFRIGHACIWCS